MYVIMHVIASYVHMYVHALKIQDMSVETQVERKGTL